MTKEEPCELQLQGFYQQVSAYRLTYDLGVNPKVIRRVYQKLQTALFHITELEEAHLGRRCNGRLGRGVAGKRVVFRLVEQDGRVYTKVVEHVSIDTLMAHIQATTRKGCVYYTDVH